jgi:hypothetical protein
MALDAFRENLQIFQTAVIKIPAVLYGCEKLGFLH